MLQQLVQLIKERRISEILGMYLSLQKAGSNYKALCPFHNENTPSFYVNDEKGIFKCFGCGKTGDAITFVQLYENISFSEAVISIAKKLGLPVDDIDNEKNVYLTFYKELSKLYSENLYHNKHALDYLYSRGIQDNSIAKFQLGYASGNLVLELAKKYKLIDKLDDLGFSRRKDPFEGRIVIPIFNEHGQVVGFSGRTLNENDKVKYLNTPETPFFRKSELLYGLNFAKQAIKELQFVVITEGYFDVIMSHQKGLTNTVGILGTYLSEDGIRKLSKLTNAALIATDSDDAGRKACENIGQSLLFHDFDVKVLMFNGVKDLAELFMKEDIDYILENSQDFLDYVVENKLQGNKNDAYSYLAQLAKSLESANLAKYKQLIEKWSVKENITIQTIEKYINKEQQEKKEQEEFVVLAEHWYLLWLLEDMEVRKWDVKLRGSAKLLAERIKKDELTPTDTNFLTRLKALTKGLPQPSKKHIYNQLKLKELEMISKEIDLKVSKMQSKEDILKLLQRKIEVSKQKTELMIKSMGGAWYGKESEYYSFANEELG